MFLVQWPINVVAEVFFIYCAFPHLLAAGLSGSPLLSYAWVAASFQARNMCVFPRGMLRLNEARSQNIAKKQN